ncbi:MAG: TonB-dependent receptor [Blastocatellia bacterium]|nr:TonB-dependent receptor [Blastocatellia bacterium]
MGFVWLVAVSILAQSGTASVSGRVIDPGGALIAGAEVSIANADTNRTLTTTTNAEGLYVFPNLPPGRYRMEVSKSGFAHSVKTDLFLHVQDAISQNFSLTVGSLEQTVTVSEGAPVIETTTSTTGGSMLNQQLINLPINGRDYARFSLMVPGAVAASNFISDLSFNGLHTVHNQFSIDGIDASRVDQPYMANGFERGARLLTGSLDTISEFKVQTGTYDTSYGRASGSYINIVSKSGTNQFHGTLMEYFRNDALDARNYFATQPRKPKFRFNDFGGNLGGPIRRDKTFFFANYEGSRQRVGITGTGTVPSASLRSQIAATSPELAPIVALYPLGTSSTADPLLDSYTTTSVSQIREDTGSIRVDHTFSSKDTAFVRVNVNDSHVFGPLFGVTPSALGLLDFQNVPVRTTNIAIQEQHVFGPHVINTFLTGMQRWAAQIISDEPYPLVNVTGLTVVPGTRGSSRGNNTSIQWGDTLSVVHGLHTFKIGGSIYRVRINRNSIDTSTVTYTSLQDFINNSIASATYTVGDPGHGTRGTEIGVFFTDTYQVRPGLTLDYGLRYDIFPAIHDRNYATQPFDTRLMTLGPVGDPYYETNKKNFAPRLGIAWRPTDKLVVRTGFGLYYQAYPVGFGSYSLPLNNIPGNTTLLRTSILGLSYPIMPFLAQGTNQLPNVSGFSWHKPDIYTEQWQLSVGYQITNDTGFQVAYVGNHGLNLRRNMNINFFDPALGRRPIPGFADVNIEYANGGSNYHGAQFSLIRRFAGGLQFDVEYTLAHAIDDVQDQGLYSAQPQDNNNTRAERGNSSDDIRHNVAFNLQYDLPMGKGHRFLGNSRGILGKAVEGWRFATIGLLRTGVAETVFIGTNTYGNGNFTNQRPDCVPGVDPYPAHQTITNWLNPAAFSMPASGTFGTCGRNTVYGPSYKDVDLSLIKNTKMSESKNLEFRAEIFNFVNHPNFDLPITTFGTPNFGKIFNTFGRTLGMGTSRQIQLALRLTF